MDVRSRIVAISVLVATVAGPAAADEPNESSGPPGESEQIALNRDGAAAARWSSTSGALGAGLFGSEMGATLDLGIDFGGADYTMGFGARMRWLADSGFRRQDWDERSEWAGLLRYLTYSRSTATTRAALALGQLGGARLGNGAVIGGYSSALDVDHRRLGAELRIEGQRYGGEGVIDDLVAPRIAGLRGFVAGDRPIGRWQLGASLSGDLAAPTAANGSPAPVPMPGPIPDVDPTGDQTREVVPIAALDGAYRVRGQDGRVSGALHGDLVAVATLAVGAHLGLSAAAELAGAQVAASGEFRLGSDRYIANWFGPLYERDRRSLAGMSSQLEVARAGGLAGLGSAFELAISHPRIGEAQLSYAHQPGLGELLSARIVAPYWRAVQGALWTAGRRSSTGADTATWAMAAELRAPLRHRLYISAELARLYHRPGDAQGMTALWLATIAIGAAWQPDPP
ncbi:MAG: hypothetical protein AAGC55_08615 [Myxococcota bacterium]